MLVLPALLVTLGLATVADSLIVRLMLDHAAQRAADEVQLGLLDRVSAADFALPATTDRVEDLALRLDPVVARVREAGSGVLRVNIVGRDGTILYSDQPDLRARTIPLADRHELETALNGGIGADETALSGEENADLRGSYSRALEVYVPVRLDGAVQGAYEIYEEIRELRLARTLLWGAMLGLWLLTALAWWTRARARPVSPEGRTEPAKPVRAPARTAIANRGRHDQLNLGLTRRELEVLELMACSHTNRQIAEQLGVGEETVRTHVKRILRKLDQPDRAQAVLTAVRAGLLELGSKVPED